MWRCHGRPRSVHRRPGAARRTARLLRSRLDELGLSQAMTRMNSLLPYTGLADPRNACRFRDSVSNSVSQRALDEQCEAGSAMDEQSAGQRPPLGPQRELHARLAARIAHGWRKVDAQSVAHLLGYRRNSRTCGYLGCFKSCVPHQGRSSSDAPSLSVCSRLWWLCGLSPSTATAGHLYESPPLPLSARALSVRKLQRPKDLGSDGLAAVIAAKANRTFG